MGASPNQNELSAIDFAEAGRRHSSGLDQGYKVMFLSLP